MTANRFIILAVLPFLLVGAAFFGARAINFEEVIFKPNELRMLYFTPEIVEVNVRRDESSIKAEALSKRRRKADIFYLGDGPTKADAAHAAVEKQVLAHTTEDLLAMKVSLIILNGRGNLAIVNNRVVIEGDTVSGMLVKRIDQDKVLLKGKEAKWVYMEGKDESL